MKKIDELILRYEQNSLSPHDCMVGIELEKIKSLYDRYKDHTNVMFVEEMIESFCKIIERQQEKAIELEKNLKNELNSNGFDIKKQPFGHGFMTALNPRHDNMPRDPEEKFEGFKDDIHLQSVFTRYCLGLGVSSYTVNDYCSRIKKTWKSFEDDYRNGKLTDDLAANYPEIPWDGALLNVYDNIEALCEYIKGKIADNEGNRNWLNARAALNKFNEFKKNF